MPPRDAIYEIVKLALTKDSWIIKTNDDPYLISYGERFLFVDLGASKFTANSIQDSVIGAEKGNSRIAIEIKEFRAKSIIKDLEQQINQKIRNSNSLNR